MLCSIPSSKSPGGKPYFLLGMLFPTPEKACVNLYSVSRDLEPNSLLQLHLYGPQTRMAFKAGKTAQKLKSFAALTEDLKLVPSTTQVTHDCLELQL